ncbi:GNAT family N-acetyltransferase [Camelimonas abortus]|uniref:GNAT family N-acetyltransferase n=1 Tax=Camelimonas abortus TaxID=1017184 RepID=A0ABV7LCU9_9HYPH
MAAIHAASFARGWDEDTMAAMMRDDMVQADGLFPPGASDSPAGFALSRCVLDEAEVLTIALAPRWRGRGLSAPLLAAHLQGLRRRGVRTVHLEVEEGNAPARRLYERFGFETVGERKGYYAGPAGERLNAILMSLALPDIDAQ